MSEKWTAEVSPWPGPYYYSPEDGAGAIYSRPIPNDGSVMFGFRVCEIDEALEDAGPDIAELLNRGTIAHELYDALEDIVERIGAWEAAVVETIGRHPKTGMDLSQARSALSKARGSE